MVAQPRLALSTDPAENKAAGCKQELGNASGARERRQLAQLIWVLRRLASLQSGRSMLPLQLGQAAQFPHIKIG
jgi:hypothetical protein